MSVQRRNQKLPKNGNSLQVPNNNDGEEEIEYEQTLPRFIAEPILSNSLSLWRVLFGLCFLKHLHNIHKQDMIGAFFWFASFNFKYAPFSFVAPMSVGRLEVLMLVMVAATLCFIVGYRYRAMTAVLLLSYSYLFLLERAWYVNHHYLYILLLFIFLVTDCNQSFSMDAYLNSYIHPYVQSWQLLLFKAMFVVVYVFAGIAKVNVDWLLRGEPIKTWFFVGSPFFRDPFLGKIFANDNMLTIVSLLGSYFGMAVDLFGGIMLCFERTRKLALIWGLSFHLMNFFLFDIGTFPFSMIASTIIWVSPVTCLRIQSRVHQVASLLLQNYYVKQRKENRTSDKTSTDMSPEKPRTLPDLPAALKIILGLFVVAQLVLPLRHYVMTSDVNWTNDGHMFAWRMMLNQEDTFLKWYARDSRDTSDPPTYYSFVSSLPNIQLTDFQRAQMKRDPIMITQFVHFFILPFMAKQYPQIPSDKLVVTCDAWRSVNNRPFQRWIDPTADLTKVAYNNPLLSHSSFILPRIAEVNESPWLQYQQNLTTVWKSRGYDVLFFCDFPGGTWEVYVAKFAQQLLVVPLRGQLEFEVWGDQDGQGDLPALRLEVGKETVVPFEKNHALANLGNDTACWMYAVKAPRGSLTKAFMMD